MPDYFKLFNNFCICALLLKSKIKAFMHCVIFSSRLLFFMSLDLGKAKKYILKKRL